MAKRCGSMGKWGPRPPTSRGDRKLTIGAVPTPRNSEMNLTNAHRSTKGTHSHQLGFKRRDRNGGMA